MFGRIFNLIGVELYKLTRQRIFYVALILIILTVGLSVWWEPPEKAKSGAEDLDGSTVATTIKARADGGFGPLTRGCQNGFKLAAIFLLIFGVLSISGETTTGTLRLVLTRPIRRCELFWAKAFSLIIVAFFIAVLIDGLSLGLTQYLFGLGNVTDATYSDTPFPQGAKALMLRYAVYYFILVLLPLLSVIFFGLFISSFVENVGMAIALAILVYLSLDYLIIGLFDNIAPYLFSYYQGFYLDKLIDLSRAITTDNWAFGVIDEWLKLGNGDIKTSGLYAGWQVAVLKSIIVPVGYIIIFAIPSLIILKKKDVLV